MMDFLLNLDRQIFFALNALHTPWLDLVMYWISDTLIWLPLYAFLLYKIFVILPRKQAITAALSVAVALTISDQLSSKVIRPRVERLRPTWNEEISAQVHTVNDYIGGHYGFPSSHAANTFCAAVIVILLLRKPWTRWMLAWALLVSYSRIYLGVHYPGDILAGALLGSACAWGTYVAYQKLANNSPRRVGDN